MFKALGRWGAQIRINGLGLFSTLFGKSGKGRKYGEIDDEAEEIFIDAKEELDSDDEISSDSHEIVVHAKPDKTNASDKGSKLNVLPSADEINAQDQQEGKEEVTESNDGNSEQSSNIDITCDVTDASPVKGENVNSDNSFVKTKVQIDKTNVDAVDTVAGKEEGEEEDEDHADVEHEHEHIEDSHHQVNHSDTKRMIKSKPTDIPKSSSSTSMFQKMHRRVNSYNQRQYAKFDNAHDEENDSAVGTVQEKASANGNNHTDNLISSIDHADGDNSLLARKSKKKRKVPFFSFIRGFFQRGGKQKL